MIDIWGETTTGDGAVPEDVIFFPGAGRDPLSEETIAAYGHLLVVAGGPAGRAAARHFIAALVPTYYAGHAGQGAAALRRATEAAAAEVAQPDALDYVAAALAGDDLYLARAGGGRAYRVRGAIVDPLARATAPSGAQPAFSLAVPLRPGDRVVICSAAAAAALGDGRALSYVAEQRSPREATARVIALARERGAMGDVSVLAAFVRAAPRLSRGQLAALLALGVVALCAVGWLAWEVWRYWSVA